jgi:hypothetical protein
MADAAPFGSGCYKHTIAIGQCAADLGAALASRDLKSGEFERRRDFAPTGASRLIPRRSGGQQRGFLGGYRSRSRHGKRFGFAQASLGRGVLQIFLVLGQGNGHQDTDDGNGDHQLNQGEARCWGGAGCDRRSLHYGYGQLEKETIGPRPSDGAQCSNRRLSGLGCSRVRASAPHSVGRPPWRRDHGFEMGAIFEAVEGLSQRGGCVATNKTPTRRQPTAEGI